MTIQVKRLPEGDVTHSRRRTGMPADPFRHRWTSMTRTEDVLFGEMQKRANAVQ